MNCLEFYYFLFIFIMSLVDILSNVGYIVTNHGTVPRIPGNEDV